MSLFEDEDSIGELEKFNRKRALQNLLSAEEHLSLNDREEDLPCSHIWCVKKHLLMTEDHMREAIEHSDGDEVYSEARKKVNDWLESDGSLGELRELRNWMRGKFNDSSINVSCEDNICSYDDAGMDKEDKNDDTELNSEEEEILEKVDNLGVDLDTKSIFEAVEDDKDDNVIKGPTKEVEKKRYEIKE